MRLVGFVLAAMLAACSVTPTTRALAPTPREGDATRESGKRAPAENTPGECPDVATAAPSTDDEGDGEHTTIDDGFEAPIAPRDAKSGPLPFADLTTAEIESRLRADIEALGSMSVGRTNGGALVAGVRMPEGDNWEIMHPSLAWGTRETVEALAHAIDAVAAKFPGTPKAFIGDISARRGGHLHPHISHQTGRDVDLGYYLTQGHRWYATANASNLDRPRTWHLVRTLIADSDVDLILVDRSIQKLLKAYALEIGEDPAWLDDVFQVGGKSQRPIIYHVDGHATHLHIRIWNPSAQELGRRAYRFLTARRVIAPPTLYVTHTVKAGETLSHLARRYKVTPEVIMKANAMKKDTLRIGKPYKIPQTGGIPVPVAVAIPARRVPPPPKNEVADRPPPSALPCARASAP